MPLFSGLCRSPTTKRHRWWTLCAVLRGRLARPVLSFFPISCNHATSTLDIFTLRPPPCGHPEARKMQTTTIRMSQNCEGWKTDWLYRTDFMSTRAQDTRRQVQLGEVIKTGNENRNSKWQQKNKVVLSCLRKRKSAAGIQKRGNEKWIASLFFRVHY